MQTTTVKLYTLPYNNVRTYLAASLFVLGNLAMPQLFHLIPQGGMVWLPIYFFTLVGAYKYGWMVGLLTAVLSPMANSVLFGMPIMGCTARHLAQIRSVGCVSRVCGFTFQESLAWTAYWGSVDLPVYRYIGRMGHERQLLACHTGFSDRHSGYVASGIRGWIFINKILNK